MSSVDVLIINYLMFLQQTYHTACGVVESCVEPYCTTGLCQYDDQGKKAASVISVSWWGSFFFLEPT